MAENVNTGGTQSFNYPKEYSLQADDELKKAIKDAYDEAHGRKRSQKIKKIIF
jgi:hypothetical protein